MMVHLRFLFGCGGSSAARIASSKTFLRPLCKVGWGVSVLKKDFLLVTSSYGLTCVSAEHSTYLTAFSSLASFSPASWVIGFCLFFDSFSMVEASSRRSICVPTSRKGVFWQWWVISGTHWERGERGKC